MRAVRGRVPEHEGNHMKFKNAFIRFVDILGSLSFAVIIVVSMAQIINRYVFGKSFVWAEELSVELMIWIAFLGAAKGTAQQSHTNLGVLVNKLPPAARCVVNVLGNLLCMAFAAVCLYYGARLSVNSWASSTTGTKIPLGLVYLAVPLSSLLMIVFLAFNSVEAVKDLMKQRKGEK